MSCLCNVISSYKGGRTSLMNAAIHGHQEVVSVLLAAGGDPNFQDKVITRGFV